MVKKKIGSVRHGVGNDSRACLVRCFFLRVVWCLGQHEEEYYTGHTTLMSLCVQDGDGISVGGL